MTLILPTRDELRAARPRRSLRTFVIDAWPIREPGTPFRRNWHIDAICEHLEAVSRGELNRLIINIPPRHMKSLAVTVLWPTWEWLTHPERRFLFSSYAQALSTRDSLKCRRLVTQPGFSDPRAGLGAHAHPAGRLHGRRFAGGPHAGQGAVGAHRRPVDQATV